MRIPTLLGLIAVAALAACSNGGGDSTPTTATVTLAGTAAKGLLSKADVAVLPVNADGTIGATPLASGETGADGRYSLQFTATPGQPYVVRVTAKAGTTHRDEVSGEDQALPPGFALRALLTPATGGNVTVTTNVTPFSELAVASATRASGGLTATNAAQASSTVQQLLGFDPTAVPVKTTSSAGSADEQKLAVLLTAVAKMAEHGDLGCAGDDKGGKVKCVVDKMSESSKIDSLKLLAGSGDSARDVSEALRGAIDDVMAEPKLSGSISSTVMTGVVANLGCTTNCASGGSGVGTVATAIAGAKLMFNEIRTDWAAMFSRGGPSPTAPGAFNKEAAAFAAAMGGVQPPVEMLAKDVSAMLLGVDLYNDFLAGRTTNPNRGKLLGEGFGSDGSGDFSGFGAIACTLFTDATATIVATTPAEAKVVGCRALYFISRSLPVPGTTVTQEWRHGFTMEPKPDGSFDYLTRARQRDTTCTVSGCSVTANVALQTEGFAGKLTPTLSLGEVVGFRLVGELPAAFASGGRTLVNFKHAVDMTGTTTLGTDGSQSIALGGTLVAYRDATTVEGTLTLKTGAVKQWPVPSGALEPGEVDLNVVWSAGGSEFEGRIALTDSALDLGQVLRLPTKAVLSGALRNTVSGTTTEFARGSLTAELVGYGSFNALLPPSATNTFRARLTLLGAVSAAGRPTLEMSFGVEADALAAQEGAGQVQLQYRTLVAGQPRQVVTVSAQFSPTAPGSFKLSEATSKISLAWGESKGDLIDLMYDNTTKIGTLDTRTWLLTFSDGTFVSLDTGL